MTTLITSRNLDVLRNSAFEIPKSRPAGDFGDFLREKNERFFEAVRRFDGPLADRLAQSDYWMRELSSSLEAVVDVTRQGRHERAWQLMEDILDEHLRALKLMSLRHTHKVMGSRSWYRLTSWKEARQRRDVFHLPFDRKAGSYRFSPPGRPAIYLGNNVYGCWLECQCKVEEIESYRVARFELDLPDNEYFLDLPTNHKDYLEPLDMSMMMAGFGNEIEPWRATNSPYLDDVERELAEYLSLWPLLMAITVQKLQPEDPPEYVIPQLLMRWVLKQKDMIGVRFFTSKFDDVNNSNDMTINVVLPAQTTGKTEGFCDVLIERVRCTPPQSFANAAALSKEELFTRDAADRREAAAGRYQIKWNGIWEHYQNTPFGAMEYLLDRPELPAKRIDAD